MLRSPVRDSRSINSILAAVPMGLFVLQEAIARADLDDAHLGGESPSQVHGGGWAQGDGIGGYALQDHQWLRRSIPDVGAAAWRCGAIAAGDVIALHLSPACIWPLVGSLLIPMPGTASLDRRTIAFDPIAHQSRRVQADGSPSRP